MPTDSRYIFRLLSPSKFTDAEDKIERLTKDCNRVLDEIGTAFRNLTGLSGVPIPFAANINMQGHKITALGEPTDKRDATTKKYVDEKIDELQQLVNEIQRLVHSELPLPGGRDITLTRAVPVVVNDTIALGSFKLTSDAHAFDIAITVSSAGFSVAKAYTIVTQRSINAGWEIALPLGDTGEWAGQDFALDVLQDDATSTLALRLRRTLGTTAGSATIQIGTRGSGNDLFLESQVTASVAAPTRVLESARFSVKDGNALLNAQTTRSALAGTSLTIRGEEGSDGRGGLELENPDPTTSSILGEIRCYNDAAFLVSILGRTDGALDAGAVQMWTTKAGAAIALALHLTGTRNLVLGGGTVAGTSGERVVVISTGVAPTTSPADSVQMYSADIAPGNAALHVRTENGSVVRLYAEAALTANDATAINATYDAVEQAVLNNVRTRLLQLENRLQAHGLLL